MFLRVDVLDVSVEENSEHSTDLIVACAKPYLPAQEHLQLLPTCYCDWKYDVNGG